MLQNQLNTNANVEQQSESNTSLLLDINEFLKLQKEELSTRKEEIDIRKKEIELDSQKDIHAFEFSKEALIKQAEDRKDERTKKFSFYNSIAKFGLLIFFIFVGLFAYAMYLGKETTVLEIIKIAATVAISVFGGYHFGKSKGIKNSQESEKNF